MVFLGREISDQRNYSDKIAEEIDSEVCELIDSAYSTATSILTENKPKLIEIAEYLILNETVEGDALENLFGTSQGPVGAHEVTGD